MIEKEGQHSSNFFPVETARKYCPLVKDKRRRRHNLGGPTKYYQDFWHIGFRSLRRADKGRTSAERFRKGWTTRTVYLPPEIRQWLDDNLAGMFSVKRGLKHLIWLFESEGDAVAFRIYIDMFEESHNRYYYELLGHQRVRGM